MSDGKMKKSIKDIENVLMKNFGMTEKPGVVIVVTLPPDYDVGHWISNLSRNNGIELLQGTIERMIGETN